MVISMSICKVEECTDKSHSLGYCQKHLLRYKKYNDPLYTKTEMHGMTKTPEYRVWHNMKSRCLYPNDKAYKHYGGRNITVCDRWLNSFVNFMADMGPKPFTEATIHRIDNDSGYSPENCVWASKEEQALHCSTTRQITYNGETMSLRGWARRIGVTHCTLSKRIARGWTLDKALNTPATQSCIPHYHSNNPSSG